MPPAAEAELRRDYEALAAMGERNYISTTAAFLAEALYRQGRDEEALRMTEESEEIAAADDVATQYLWRSVRAKLVARQGRFDEAEAHGCRGDPDHRDGPGPGLAGLRLRSTWPRSSGWPAVREDAMRAAEAAAALFDRKANLASAGRARRLRDEIDAGLTVGG